MLSYFHRPLRVLSALRICRLTCHVDKNQFSSSCKTGQGNISTVTQCMQKVNTQTTNKSRLEGLPGFVGLEPFRDKGAIVDQGGEYLYEDLYMRSWDLAKALIGVLGESWTGNKICLLCDTGLSHVISSWCCWMLGNTVVPLPVNGTKEKLEHIIRDSGATLIISTKSQVDKVNSIAKAADLRLIGLDESWWKNPECVTDRDTPLPPHFVENTVYKEGNAFILYTVGRTFKSRGIILSHSTLCNQINSVVDRWDLTSDDTMLHSLNLHQAFPLVSCLHAPLNQRAKVLTLNTFNAGKVWSHLLGVNKSDPVTLFAATPLMYHKLLEQSPSIFTDKKSRDYVKFSCNKKIRLMTTNTTKMSEHITTHWNNLTGHKIMTNFVSTEACLVMSGGSQGTTLVTGCHGPVPGVQIKIVKFRDHLKSSYDVLLEDSPNSKEPVVKDVKGLEENDGIIIGELLMKGDNVSTKYLSEAVESDVTIYDDYVATGDIVAHSNNNYWIKGKLGVKGVEVGGEVVNAAELERNLLKCADIDDTTVVGLGDTDAEQQIAAVVVVNKNKKITLESVLTWCQQNMGHNSVPTVLKIVDKIPRDNSGHIDKCAVFNMFPDINVVCFHDTKF